MRTKHTGPIRQESIPVRNRASKARLAFLAAGAGALAAAVASGPAPAAPGAAPVPLPQVVVRPDFADVASTGSAPATTAQCLRDFGFPCFGPDQLQAAYSLPALYRAKITGKGTTIVIVDPFGSPTIRHDTATFDRQFHLPAPPSFKIIAPAGKIPPYDPASMAGSAGETTLDVDYAHAMAPGAGILLVETPAAETVGTAGFPQIVAAEKYVINHNMGDVISQSFSATEETFASFGQLAPLRAAYVDAYAHHVTVLASPGDRGATDFQSDGELFTSPVVSWPDSDPLVTGVGGTQLIPGRGKPTWAVFNDSLNKAVNEHFAGEPGPNAVATGGGKSEFFARPGYQDSVRSVTGARRGVPDISMNGACSSPVDVFISFAGLPSGWNLACGDSESTPLFSGIVALADQVAGHRLGLINPRLYALSARHAPGIVDVTSGSNTVSFRQGPSNQLITVHGFPATKGYDLASGVGTINAPAFVRELAGR